ncbi:MAG: hypothetical protein JXR19_11085 [Bacteroidia bacterium]
MKKILLLFTILGTITTYAQNIKQGDNLKTEFRKMTKPFYFSAPSFTSWTEGSDMLIIAAKPNINDCDFVFIALQDTTLIGIFTTKAPNVFMFDTENNSILDKSSDFFLLPLWTVKNKTKIISSDKTILELLDKMYEETLQANDLELDEKTIIEYKKYQTDTTLANRHIALLFDNYQTIITEAAAKGEKAPAEICVPLMKSLAGECVSLYNNIPVIVCVYMGEALQSAGMIDNAREHFIMSLQFYPNSIPLQVYNYQLEQDQAKKKKQLADLKRKYPKHWMIKNL